MVLIMKKAKRNKILIGTRGSKLAVWQAEWVKNELLKLYKGLEVELVKIKTTGDKILDVPLAKVGGKGLFVKEIEESLLRREIDLAVHSMKDVPTDLPEGLHLAVVCEREEPRDAFISKISDSGFQIPNFKSLPFNSKIGTSSLRRSCQLLNLRPDLRIEHLRGNLDTRLRKLDEGQYDGIILAAAGMRRLGLEKRITELLPFDISLPAIGQGAIGVECRIDDEFINELLLPLNHAETYICVKAERSFLKKLGGGCQVPIAAYATVMKRSDNKEPEGTNLLTYASQKISHHQNVSQGLLLILEGLVGTVNGDRIIRGRNEGNPEEAEMIGIRLAEDILSRGAKEILENVYG